MIRYKKIGFLAFSTLVPWFLKAQEQPNIIIVYTDDQGYGDLGCYGATDFSTPNIDYLAENGVRFTNFYSPQAVSSASRAGLLTGCYPNRIKITGALMPNSLKGINSDEVTIAEMLKQQGYKTAIFGKWHLGSAPAFNPIYHGFDQYYGIPYSVDMIPMEYDGQPPLPTTHRYRYPKLPLYHNDSIIAQLDNLPGIDSLTRFLTERAVEFIENQQNEPFFIYFPHPMPHTPLGGETHFRGISKQGKYGDVITEIDWSVGELIKTLEKENKLNNTIIIFTSDNGPWLNFGKHAGSTGGLREGKGTTWEGGQRVPCVIYWNGHFPRGKVITQMGSAIDILPTLAEITNAKLPDLQIDGISLLENIQNPNSQPKREVFLYYYESNQLQAIRYKNWKLVYPHTYRTYETVPPGENGMPGPYDFKKSGKELYNLENDFSESNNVIEQHPEIVKIIDSIAIEARLDLGDDLTNIIGKNSREPGFAQKYDNKVNHIAMEGNLSYETAYSTKYSGGGNRALIDGLTGFSEFSHNTWQGFEGVDFVGVLELKEEILVNKIKIGFMENQGSWIFLPETISLEFSSDGIHYSSPIVCTTLEIKNTEIFHRMELEKPIGQKCKYIRIKVKNIGTCPDNHEGKGNPAWLFMDEIMVY